MRYTYDAIKKENAEEIESIFFPGEEFRSFTDKVKAFYVCEFHGTYTIPYIVVIEDNIETERINPSQVVIINWKL